MMRYNILHFFTLLVLLGTFLALGLSWYFVVLVGSVWYFLVLFGLFWFCLVFFIRIGTFWYFLTTYGTCLDLSVLLSTSWCFWDIWVKHIGTFWYFWLLFWLKDTKLTLPKDAAAWVAKLELCYASMQGGGCRGWLMNTLSGLVNAGCPPGKITKVQLRGDRNKHWRAWLILVTSDIANQMIGKGKEAGGGKYSEEKSAISKRLVAKILRHWFKLGLWATNSQRQRHSHLVGLQNLKLGEANHSNFLQRWIAV